MPNMSLGGPGSWRFLNGIPQPPGFPRTRDSSRSEPQPLQNEAADHVRRTEPFPPYDDPLNNVQDLNARLGPTSGDSSTPRPFILTPASPHVYFDLQQSPPASPLPCDGGHGTQHNHSPVPNRRPLDQNLVDTMRQAVDRRVQGSFHHPSISSNETRMSWSQPAPVSDNGLRKSGFNGITRSPSPASAQVLAPSCESSPVMGQFSYEPRSKTPPSTQGYRSLPPAPGMPLPTRTLESIRKVSWRLPNGHPVTVNTNPPQPPNNHPPRMELPRVPLNPTKPPRKLGIAMSDVRPVTYEAFPIRDKEIKEFIRLAARQVS